MSNKLKKFIWDNRKAFDDAVPAPKVWEHIEASFAPQKKKKFILTPVYKWSMAAAAMLVLASGIYFLSNRDKGEIIAAAKTDSTDMHTFIPEAPEMVQIVKMIDARQEELKMLTKDQPGLYQEFSTAIDQLDSSYNNLKSQLGATPNREVLLQAMIQNLQLQLNVLNQQLTIIHQIKEAKNNSHEKIM